MDLDPSSAARAADAAHLPASADACLVTIYGPELGRRWCMESELVIGRDASCGIHIPIDTISRQHCRLRRDGAAVLVEDLGSTNGTILNDEVLAASREAVLRSGDRLRVGSAIFRFLAGNDLESLYHEEIHRTVVTDGLTGAHTRRSLAIFLDREMARFRRRGRPLSLVLFDLDGFARVNESFGRLTGDAVLLHVAGRVLTQVRREDCLARCDGARFAVALTETDAERARYFAERLREQIGLEPVRVGEATVPVTISAGVATAGPDGADPDGLLACAMGRLAEAKAAGRDRVVG
jgi:two-component system cell cycle response regulator